MLSKIEDFLDGSIAILQEGERQIKELEDKQNQLSQNLSLVQKDQCQTLDSNLLDNVQASSRKKSNSAK